MLMATTASRIYCFFTFATTLNICETSWSFSTNENVKIISNINIIKLTNIFFILLFFSFSMLSSFSVLNLSFICDFYATFAQKRASLLGENLFYYIIAYYFQNIISYIKFFQTKRPNFL